ncbi:helix-turn-helix transcriptional regulator [Kribbella deserti]|uniref:Helix-turn-helix transcriptional regulator n=1 Tax=Kribbella deserti TaxID=1926257 RepID=A0ABV6QHT4_9ACTN
MTIRPDLGEFLQTRRSRIRPEEVGLPSSPDRRVAGLRREEVALLSNVSVDYYIRLEQGRAANPSHAVLTAVASALRLSETEREHLLALANPAARRRPEPAKVRPQLAAMVNALRELPAVVLDRLSNVLVWNPAAAVVLGDFANGERNLARRYFLDPASRTLYSDWESAAKDMVAHLRKMSAEYADDPELAELVEELSALSPEFAGWWSGHDVSTRSHCPKMLNHPGAGRLTFSLEVLVVPADDGQAVLTYTPADQETESAVEALLQRSSAARIAG